MKKKMPTRPKSGEAISLNSRSRSNSSDESERLDGSSKRPNKTEKKPTPKIIKILQVILTLFYGQFFANAIFDNFIRGIPYLVEEATPYSVIRVIVGVFIIALTILGMISIWFKVRILLFLNAFLLSIVFIFAIVVSIIDLVRRHERKVITEKELNSAIIENVIESVFRVIAIGLIFLMIKVLSKKPRVILSPPMSRAGSRESIRSVNININSSDNRRSRRIDL
jgi:hypothetical protein